MAPSYEEMVERAPTVFLYLQLRFTCLKELFGLVISRREVERLYSDSAHVQLRKVLHVVNLMLQQEGMRVKLCFDSGDSVCRLVRIGPRARKR